MAKAIKVWDGSSWQNLGLSFPDITSFATQTYVDTAVSNLVNAAPSTLDTLNELAAALGDDANYASSVTTSLGLKQDKVSGVSNTEIGYLDGVTSSIQTQLDSKASISYVDLIQYGTAISGTTYTLGASDLGKLIETTSSSSITVTIPSDPTDSTFPIGSSVEFRQMGTGRIAFSATSPATMVSTDSYTKTRTQYSSIVLEKRASNAWILAGDIDA